MPRPSASGGECKGPLKERCPRRVRTLPMQAGFMRERVPGHESGIGAAGRPLFQGAIER